MTECVRIISKIKITTLNLKIILDFELIDNLQELATQF